MSETENKKSHVFFSFIRYFLLLAMAGFLLLTLAKDNPKVQQWIARFSAAQDPSAVASDILNVSGETMGTFWNVKAALPPKGWTEERLSQTVSAALDRVDRLMSTYRSDSEISRFNASDSTDWFDVSPETARVTALALDVSRLTDGAFDPTVAPLVNLWKFGPDKKPLQAFPSAETVEQVRSECGWQKLEVRVEQPSALRKSAAEVSLDLSGVAKGYAVDAAVEALLAEGFSNIMVDVGGETRCVGRKAPPTAERSEGTPWTLGIEKPIPTPDAPPELFCIVRQGDRALATSGSARNFYRIDGVSFSHIIDPRTGRPVEIQRTGEPPLESVRGSVSVFDDTCVRADALATGLFVLGVERGIALADELNLPVMFISRSTADESLFEQASSKAFAAIDSVPAAELNRSNR